MREIDVVVTSGRLGMRATGSNDVVIADANVAAIGEAWCFLGNALSYIAVIAGLLAIRIRRDPVPKAGARSRAVNVAFEQLP